MCGCWGAVLGASSWKPVQKLYRIWALSTQKWGITYSLHYSCVNGPAPPHADTPSWSSAWLCKVSMLRINERNALHWQQVHPQRGNTRMTTVCKITTFSHTPKDEMTSWVRWYMYVLYVYTSLTHILPCNCIPYSSTQQLHVLFQNRSNQFLYALLIDHLVASSFSTIEIHWKQWNKSMIQIKVYLMQLYHRMQIVCKVEGNQHSKLQYSREKCSDLVL